jgi:lysophospholipid acyltransferase (LPLAT)-like uncharacterized protein
LSRLLGFLLGCLVRVLSFTWRVTVVAPDGLFARREPLVFAFWHGKQLALQGVRLRRPALALVSHSRDGKLQASALGVLGFRIVRGSSSRGGATATKRILNELAAHELDAVFAVDGPRGPREHAKPGALGIARLAGGLVVPVGSACSHSVVLERAWDRFEIPLPFAHVAVVAGEPLAHEDGGELDAAIHAAVRRADALVNPAKVGEKRLKSA